jgi:hypothetical protein
MTFEQDLRAAAEEEIDQACALGWDDLAKVTPWGDSFDGFTPSGRAVTIERGYLWAGVVGGDIRVEVTVYEARAFEAGVTVTRTLDRTL